MDAENKCLITSFLLLLLFPKISAMMPFQHDWQSEAVARCVSVLNQHHVNLYQSIEVCSHMGGGFVREGISRPKIVHSPSFPPLFGVLHPDDRHWLPVFILCPLGSYRLALSLPSDRTMFALPSAGEVPPVPKRAASYSNWYKVQRMPASFLVWCSIFLSLHTKVS